ncbi:MAG TPA: glycosyltransferase [Ktedonobacteraceae bacterium]|nr:glycosyltransferase [Ktedonobacteraceae bacterium]
MISETAAQLQNITQRSIDSSRKTAMIFYTVGVMAYNEEANIQRTLLALLEQSSEHTQLDEIIVVASGCTDRTVSIVQEMQATETRIHLLIQERREGKASAINLFLQHAHSPVLAMIGADIIPEKTTLEKLCTHFNDPAVGMVGARPVPVNDQYTFVGYAVHLLWRLHDRMARRSPKLGEAVAFRNILNSIPVASAVDEISIEASVASSGLQLVYEPAALVYNKGPMTVRDFLKQRRRIHAGHLQVRSQERYEASTMKVGPILQELLAEVPYIIHSPKQAMWAIGTVGLEGLARLQGHYDLLRKRSHHVWQTVESSKVLEDEARKLRRICNSQSVIVFHIFREDADAKMPEREQLLTTRIVRKLLPTLHSYIRREDILSIMSNSGTSNTTMVAVLNADREGAELAAQRLREVMMVQRIPLKKGDYTRLLVSYHAVSFAL